jgi:hypothetical protein
MKILYTIFFHLQNGYISHIIHSTQLIGANLKAFKNNFKTVVLGPILHIPKLVFLFHTQRKIQIKEISKIGKLF